MPFSRRSFELARYEQVQNHDDHALPATRETQECLNAHGFALVRASHPFGSHTQLIDGSNVGQGFCFFLKRESAHVAYQLDEPSGGRGFYEK